MGCSGSDQVRIDPEDSAFRSDPPDVTVTQRPLSIGEGGKETEPMRVVHYREPASDEYFRAVSVVVDPAGDSVSVLTPSSRHTWAHPASGERLTVLPDLTPHWSTSTWSSSQWPAAQSTPADRPTAPVETVPGEGPDTSTTGSTQASSDAPASSDALQALLSGVPQPQQVEGSCPDEGSLWASIGRLVTVSVVGLAVGFVLGAIGPGRLLSILATPFRLIG